MLLLHYWIWFLEVHRGHILISVIPPKPGELLWICITVTDIRIWTQRYHVFKKNQHHKLLKCLDQLKLFFFPGTQNFLKPLEPVPLVFSCKGFSLSLRPLSTTHYNLLIKKILLKSILKHSINKSQKSWKYSQRTGFLVCFVCDLKKIENRTVLMKSFLCKK